MSVLNTDIGINPVGTRHDRVLAGYATETGIKFGDVVRWDTASTGNRRAIIRTTVAGDNQVAGVVVSQTDPTSGSAIGDLLEVCDLGICEVNLVASQALTKGDLLITSTTAGAVKKLAAEATPDILGRVNMDMASNVASLRVSVNVNIYQHA